MMSAEDPVITVENSPQPPSNSPDFLIPLAIGTLFIIVFASLYLFKDQLFIPSKQLVDPTTKKEAEASHGTIWLGFFQLDTETHKATLIGDPQVTNSDLFIQVLSQKPPKEDNEWIFEVVLENSKGEIVYRSFRKISKFPLKENEKIWEFGAAVPYKAGSVLHIFDEEGEALFTREL